VDIQNAALEHVLKDPHTRPLIGAFDDTPFAYIELYWVKEDILGPFINGCGDWARGFHCLVGEESMRGPHRAPVWLSSMAYFAFLDDCRTQHVYLEPRVDNAKLIHYLQSIGFYREKEVRFPHKSAAVMCISREHFFAQGMRY
jgi:hypothetical protein